MSLFDNPEYRWRETYLLFHKKSQRAMAAKVVQTIEGIRGHYNLEQVVADPDGYFESGTVFAEEAFAAIDLSYVEDDQIREQIAEIHDSWSARKRRCAQLPGQISAQKSG